MIKQIEQLFAKMTHTETGEALDQRDLYMASAALLVEVATIDQNFDAREWQVLQELLVHQCHLSAQEVDDFIKAAQQASRDSASLYDFTQKINRHFSYSEKIELVRNLWRIAYADGSLDKYEEHIIRRIADLIHLSHSDFIQAKIAVRNQ